LKSLSDSHYNAAMIIVEPMCFGVIKSNGKYYFTDSHNCDENGNKAYGDGTACIIECNSEYDIVQICIQRAGGKKDVAFNLDYIDITEIKNLGN